MRPYLQLCADLAVRVIPGAHDADITTHHHGHPSVTAHTDTVLLGVDAHQHPDDDRPRQRTGDVARADPVTSRQPWTELTHDTEVADIRTVLTAPLGPPDAPIGVLSLHSHDPDDLANTDHDVGLLLVLTEHATRALLDAYRLLDADALATQLRHALTSRAPIDQAKGILMAAHQIDADAAFVLLREQSQNSNTKLSDVASTFIARTTTPTPEDA